MNLVAMSVMPLEGFFQAAAVLFAMLPVCILVAAAPLALYVTKSFGLYAIAKRRRIRNPWLAWIPIGDQWILGSISDQYRYVVKGKTRNRRKAILWLTVATHILAVAYYLGYFVGLFHLALSGNTGVVFGAMSAGLLVVVPVAVIAGVIRYCAVYDLYLSCDPDNAVLYLVLNILAFDITYPLFLFLCRKKDLGMPPRKDEIPVAQVEDVPMEEPVSVEADAEE